jgi:hypothetical protein
MAGTLRSALHPQRSRHDPVRVARPEHVLPEDHVADEHVFLLHCEEAAQVALGEIELAHAPASRGSIEAQRHRNSHPGGGPVAGASPGLPVMGRPDCSCCKRVREGARQPRLDAGIV